jgi:F-type H+-transporting ATPase subunit epsilon
MLNLKVITPTGIHLSASVHTVTAPGSEGEFQVLPSHLPTLALLGGGVLKYESESTEGRVFIRGGVAEVSPDGQVLILTEDVQNPDALDLDRAQQIKAESEKALSTEAYLNDAGFDRIHQDLAFAEAVLKA